MSPYTINMPDSGANKNNKTVKKGRKIGKKLKLQERSYKGSRKSKTSSSKSPGSIPKLKRSSSGSRKLNKTDHKAVDANTNTFKLKMSKSVKNKSRKLKIVQSLKPKVETNAMKTYNEEYVSVLSQLEDIMMRQGEPFRAKAYRTAAESIMMYPNDITDPKQLEGQKGVGKTIMAKLEEYTKTGKLNAIEKYKDDPVNILTRVYGIGPKKAKEFAAQGIDTIAKLQANMDKLTAAQKLGVEFFDDIEKRIPRDEIETYKTVLDKIFKDSTPEGSLFEIVGSFRRGAVSSGDIDIIITNTNNNHKAFTDFLDALIKDNVVTHVLSRGKTKSLTIARLPGKPARRVDLMYTSPKEYAFAILYFTGSKSFNTMQRQRALDIGYTLNEHGMHKMVDGKKGEAVQGDFPDEKAIFDFLGMEFKTPAQRIDGRSVVIKKDSPVVDEIVMMDMQDVGKAEVFAKKDPSPQKEASPEKPSSDKNKQKKAKTTKNKTLKKSKESADELITTFKAEGKSALVKLTEKQLETMIKAANDAYYDNKTPLMTDGEYDVVREYTQERFPKNAIAKEGHVLAAVEASKSKVKLPYEMWSMDKIKPDTGVLPKWTEKYQGPYVLSCKLDGVSGLYSTEGKEPKLYTRGNGTVGQDVSHMIPFLRLPSATGLVIRGEFIISKQKFDEKYSSEFSNPRNFVAGVVNQKKADTGKMRDLDFVAYELIKPEMKPSEQMMALTEMPIEVVMFLKESKLSNELLSELLVAWRQDYKYEIDGVICTNDEMYPRTRGNPDHAFAFKMVLSDQIAEVKVVDVLWTASKDGYLKPRVQVDPVVLGGAKIEYATGFNAKFIVDNKIGVGAIIKLIRSGDVIPHIVSVLEPASKPMMPNVPYKWNETEVDIELEDKSGDDTVAEKVLLGFFKGISVDGMGPGTVSKLVEAGYKTIPSVIRMSKGDFVEVDGLGPTTAEKLHDGIKDKIIAATLPELMHATNIFGRGFGTKKLAAVMEENPDILVSDDTPDQKVTKAKAVSGMAKKSASVFVDKIPEFVAWAYDAGVESKLVYIQPSASIKDKEHELFGKKIVMTGFRDKDLVKAIEAVGASNSGSVSKNTFVVLVKDVNEDTGKADQARKLGVPLMTPENFKEKYNIS
jgi:NAD-dependent DNA ligase/DNA polymerase/3'-5' exonuclease PolX